MVWNGRKIDELRRERGLTLGQIATEIGVSRQSVSQWIKGTSPRGEHLFSLANILEVSPTDFFEKSAVKPISVPRHRTSRKRPVKSEMIEACSNMAEAFLGLFQTAPDCELVPVARVEDRSEFSAKKLAAGFRELAGVERGRPMGLDDAFRLLSRLQTYVVFWPFPTPVKKDYAFFVTIFGHRVIFVNNHTKGIDLIFQLLHEAVHAVRDEDPNEVGKDQEEIFCDRVAGYAQFPDDYVNVVANTIRGRKAGEKTNLLKEFSRKYQHSLYGILLRLDETGCDTSKVSRGAITTLKREYLTVGEYLQRNGDARAYVEQLRNWSPAYLTLVAGKQDEVSDSKLAEWAGLASSLDAWSLREELTRIRRTGVGG